MLVKESQRLPTTLGGGHPVAFGHQDLFEQVPHGLLVIHHQYPGRLACTTVVLTHITQGRYSS